jgi:hypothetical protein
VRPIAGVVTLALLSCNEASQPPPGAPQPPVAAAPAPADPLLLSFAWMGGCREGNKEWDRAKNPSSANVAQLSQTLTDLAAIAPNPRYLFFPGDLVLGLDSDAALTSELVAWTVLFKTHPSGLASRMTLVPTMGNHEALLFHGHDEIPNPAANAAFVAWLGASGFDSRAGNGPTNAPPNADSLADDERKLSYSFDDGPVHFVVLDTDSLTTTPDAEAAGTQVGWVPFHWLKADVEAAQARPGTQAIFLLGHKPLVRPDGGKKREDVINLAMNADVAKLLDDNAKVKGYLTSHDHLWDARRLGGKRGVWQVISGNGGSALDAKWAEPHPWFGFTLVRVYASGKVALTPYERPVPAPYDAPATEPAKPGAELVLSP